MLKFEGKSVNDSLLKGVLYMRNQMPKVEWFFLGRNTIGGDWQREGTFSENQVYTDEPVASKTLSDKVLYIKISSFMSSNAKNIDSIFRVNKEALRTTPYLVLDLRDNGGGADHTYIPILPYIYTNPVREIGADVLATEPNIAGWEKSLEDGDMSGENKISMNKTIKLMQGHKGQLVNYSDDRIDSSFKPIPYPSKVAILINQGCASTTEQFLLYARQSSKVLLLGQNTSGTLDYSNWKVMAFSCLPYILNYSTTRSRRLDIHEGIDNVGIKPDHYLELSEDWLRSAVSVMDN